MHSPKKGYKDRTRCAAGNRYPLNCAGAVPSAFFHGGLTASALLFRTESGERLALRFPRGNLTKHTIPYSVPGGRFRQRRLVPGM